MEKILKSISEAKFDDEFIDCLKNEISLSKIKNIYSLIEHLLRNFIVISYKKGYLYCIYNQTFIQYGQDVYKLGCTKNMNKRLSTYATCYLNECVVKHCSSLLNYYEIAEIILFKELNQYRLSKNREFFKCNEEIIKNKINEIANMMNSQDILEIINKYTISNSKIKGFKTQIIRMLKLFEKKLSSQIDYKKFKSNEKKKIIFRFEKDEIESIDLNLIKDIIKSSLINNQEYIILNNGLKNQNENFFKIQKYKLYDAYKISNKVNEEIVIDFLKNNTIGLNVQNQVNNWFSHKFQDKIEDIKNINHIKANVIKKLLKQIGFQDDLLSTNIVNPIDFKISEVELKEIRYLFRNNGDVGRVSGKNLDQHDFIRLVDRLCNVIFGIKLKWETKWKNKVRFYFNYKLIINNVVLEYLIINFKNDLIKTNKKYYETISNNTFKYSHIHGYSGIFKDYINNNIDFYHTV